MLSPPMLVQVLCTSTPQPVLNPFSLLFPSSLSYCQWCTAAAYRGHHCLKLCTPTSACAGGVALDVWSPP